MSHKKSNETLRTARHLGRLEWETKKETGLQGTDNEFGIELAPENAGTTEMRNLIKAKEDALKREGARKFDPEL